MVDQQWDSGVIEFGRVVRSAVADAGGFDLVMHSETEPALRSRKIEPLLESLGVFELDPTGDEQQLQAAAAACRAAGGVALPYPVAERLSSPWKAEADPSAVAVVADAPRINMGDLLLRWHAVTPAGRVYDLVGRSDPMGGKLGPFVADATLVDPRPGPPHLVPLVVVLSGFTLLGMLESAHELTVRHVQERVQFGTPIIQFQAVRHQLADALVRIQMFERQLLYAMWSRGRAHPDCLVDAVGARVAGLRAANIVLRVGHQLHGATGFCDEAPISWISRHSQPLRRLPLNLPGTEKWLAELVMRQGYDGPFRSAPLGPEPEIGEQPAVAAGKAAQ